MLYTQFHAIRKRWLLLRMAVIAAVVAAPLNGQQPAGSVTLDPSATSESKQSPTMSSASSTKNDPNAEVSVQDSSTTFGRRVNLAQVHVMVRDVNNNPVAHLKQEDFQLFDQDKLQPISLFTRKSAARVDGGRYQDTGSRVHCLDVDDSHISLDDATCCRQVVPGFLDEIIPN